MCRASAPGARSGHRAGNRRADNCRERANRPTAGWSSAPERTPWGGQDRRVRTQAEAQAPEEGSFSASDACSDDRLDGFRILGWETLTSAVNDVQVQLDSAPETGGWEAAEQSASICVHRRFDSADADSGHGRPPRYRRAV